MSEDIKEKIIEQLKEVVDPELQVDIYTLGLIYGIDIADKITVTMTLTSPMCPYGPQIIHEVKEGVKKVKNVDVEIDLTFDPPWEPNDDVKMMLGLL